MPAQTPRFPGFPPEGMQFLRSLKRNNRREWFQPRKQIYEERVKAPMVELVSAVNTALMSFAPAYVKEPSEAIYRVYRDTRFSNDKTPYKTHIGAIFPKRSLGKHGCAGFYFHVAPKEIEIAGGVYMPDREQLRAIRGHLAAHHEEFRAIVRDRRLRTLMGELQGEQLSRVPKGFCSEDPAADLLRYKQWLFWKMLDVDLATTPKMLPEIVKRFRAMFAFVEFLNVPLSPARRPGWRFHDV
jgi:uncharacterized protein (TIGR02453 family)